MAPATKKINFIIQDDVARDLEAMVPAGERSRLVNVALRRELLALKRRALTDRLTVIRQEGPVYEAAAIVRDLKRERSRK